MENGQLVGLLKFFRDDDKLRALEAGLFYCNTPEHYRLSGDEGVSDLHESCSLAYRASRSDKPIKLTFGEHEIEGLTAVTVHTQGINDKWIHCWFALRVPADESELESLAADINRMRKEFGHQYAFLQGGKIKDLVERLKAVTEHSIDHGSVRYSDDRMDWSAICKSQAYSYQREYRFVIGDCGHTSLKPMEIKCCHGFSDLLSISPTLRITDDESGHVWFHLDADECYSRGTHNNSFKADVPVGPRP